MKGKVQKADHVPLLLNPRHPHHNPQLFNLTEMEGQSKSIKLKKIDGIILSDT